MPIIKSAQKRMRQEKKKRVYNAKVKTAVKSKFKAVKEEIASGKPKSSEQLITAVAEIDRAVKKGVLHKKTADRKKSRLTKAYNAVADKPFGTEKSSKPKTKTTKKPATKKAPVKK